MNKLYDMVEIDGVKFEFNNEIKSRVKMQKTIVRDFKQNSPDSVKRLLGLLNCKIRFRNQKYFLSKGKKESVLGYYSEGKSITIRSDLMKCDMINTLHHEIGHFVDYILCKSAYYENGNLVSMGSENRHVLYAMRDESHIYDSSYYRTSSDEFFAQSYSEYVCNTGLLDSVSTTGTIIEESIKFLDEISDVYKEDIMNVKKIYKLNDAVYLGYDRKNLSIYFKRKDFIITLKNVERYTISNYEFMDINDFMIEVHINGEDKQYILKEYQLDEVEYTICKHLEYFKSGEVNFSVIKYKVNDDNFRYDFILNDNGDYVRAGYEFKEIIRTGEDYEGKWYMGIVNNETVLFDENLNNIGTVSGIPYLDCEVINDEKKETWFFFEEDGKIVLYKEDLSDSKICIEARKFYIYGWYLFIKDDNKSFLINLGNNTFTENDWDIIDECKTVEEMYIENWDTSRQVVKLKKGDEWYLGMLNNGDVELINKYGVKSHELICIEYAELAIGVNFYNEDFTYADNLSYMELFDSDIVKECILVKDCGDKSKKITVNGEEFFQTVDDIFIEEMYGKMYEEDIYEEDIYEEGVKF